jgi:hypothetical protein
VLDTFECTRTEVFTKWITDTCIYDSFLLTSSSFFAFSSTEMLNWDFPPPYSSPSGFTYSLFLLVCLLRSTAHFPFLFHSSASHNEMPPPILKGSQYSLLRLAFSISNDIIMLHECCSTFALRIGRLEGSPSLNKNSRFRRKEVNSLVLRVFG